MRIRTAMSASFSTAAVVLAACGGGSSDKDQISKIITDGGRDPATICDHIAAGVLKAIGGKDGCVKASKSSGVRTQKFKVDSVVVKGDRATAKITGRRGRQTLEFAKEHGDWKVSPGD